MTAHVALNAGMIATKIIDAAPEAVEFRSFGVVGHVLAPDPEVQALHAQGVMVVSSFSMVGTAMLPSDRAG